MIASPPAERPTIAAPTTTAVSSPASPDALDSGGIIDQLNRHISALATTDPVAPLTDLDSFGQIVGDAQIVGIGEATHGTHEFMTMHDRMIRYLITEHEFRIVGLEAPAAMIVGLDRYVRGETDDAATVQSAFGFFSLANTDFWHWVTWLRAYNQHVDPASVVRLVGIDSQANRLLAPSLIVGFLTPLDADIAASLAELYDSAQALTGTDTAVEQSQAALAALLDAEPGLVAASSQREFDQAEYLAQAIVQDQQLHFDSSGTIGGPAGLRDKQLADNIRWVLDHEDAQAPIVVWAHNDHVAAAQSPSNAPALAMGGFLREQFGDRYRPIGLSFASGEYIAYPAGTTSRTPTTYELPEPPSGSAAALFAQLSAQRFLLDLRAVPPTSVAGQWLGVPTFLPSVGAIHMRNPFQPITIAGAFDGLCFIAATTPITPLSADVVTPQPGATSTTQP